MLKTSHGVFDKSSSKILITCQGASNADDFSKKINRINELKDKIKLSQDEKLFKDIKQLETEYPNDPEIAALFAEFYFRKGQFCKATDILKQAKNNNFWSKSYNYSLSLSAQKCGDSETSKQALEEILKFSPYDELAKNRLKNVNI